MKISLKNIGLLKDTEFELNDLTIICGDNNSGKTYAAYSMFSFLDYFYTHFNLLKLFPELQEKLDKRRFTIDLRLFQDRQTICNVAWKQCSGEYLAGAFASSNKELFVDAEIKVDLEKKESELFVEGIEQNVDGIVIQKIENSWDFNCVFPEEETKVFVMNFMNLLLKRLLFYEFLPEVHICTVERTGISMFRGELELSNLKGSIQYVTPSYAIPIGVEHMFMRRLERLQGRESWLQQNHPEIITEFMEITGGKYSVQNNILSFQPKEQNLNLLLREASSCTKALVNLYFWLRHEAKEGQLLIIDEPELTLHPRNQRKFAQFLVKLINLGFKVFLTTHSDYFIKEFNILIMLNSMKEFAKERGYDENALLEYTKVNVYETEQVDVGNYRLEPSKIDAEYGIELGSFNAVIDEMNELEEDILWEREQNESN